jgi:hypothetical protein
MPKDEDEDFSVTLDTDELTDDEPIPARRDTRIFHIKKNDDNKDDEFDEDIFV